MNDFNKQLINKVKLLYSEEIDDCIYEEKYSFLKYIFSIIESRDIEDLTICTEEYIALNCNIDGFYYDVDSGTYNLYLVVYNNEINDNVEISKELLKIEYNKIINTLKKIFDNSYHVYDESSLTFEICNEISKDLKNCEIVVNIYTNYNISQSNQKDNIEEIGNQRVSFRTYDFEDLHDKLIQIKKDSSEIDCIDMFGESINSLKIATNSDFDVYLFSIKGISLAKLYKEDSERLLEANVRSYLKRTAKVNAGIFDTVQFYPNEFVSYNNGISAVATNILCEDGSMNNKYNITKLYNFQIVNGGQTTATLFECMKGSLLEQLDDVIVPVKLTVVKNISNTNYLINNISLYSNTQTAIKKSDPPSNIQFYVDLKKISNNCISNNGNNYICYFERMNGEYDTELRRNNSSESFSLTYPRNMKFTKLDLAIGINCWQQIPYVVAEGREKNFTRFTNIVKNLMLNLDDDYFKRAYSTVILFRSLDRLAKKNKIPYKSSVVSYTLSLLSYLTNKKIDLLKIWDMKKMTLEMEKISEKLMSKVSEIIINAPIDHPEPRMWARKIECWEKVKLIKCPIDISILNDSFNFFPDNDAQLFIDNDDNFYTGALWGKLLIWNTKYKIFNEKHVKMLRTMKNLQGKDIKLTTKQITYAKDLFILAVKNKFNYKEV